MRNQQQVTQRSPVTLSRCVRAAAAGFMFALSLGWSGAMAEQHVKRLVIAMDPANADTNLYWASASDVTTFPALGRLVGNDPKTGKYNDDGLALRWETNEDLSKWTFYLRKNAEWHYGWGKVTAHDVAHSYDLHIVDDATQSGTPQLRGAKVEVIDDYTISFAFKQPRVNFLFVVASRGSMLIYSKALRKRLSAYTKSTPPHVAAARKLTGRRGRIIDYVITTDGPEPAAERRSPIDREHYVQKQVRAVAEPVLTLLGLDFDRVIGDDSQLRLF